MRYLEAHIRWVIAVGAAFLIGALVGAGGKSAPPPVAAAAPTQVAVAATALPTPNVDATVSARVQATITAQPRPTTVPTAAPTFPPTVAPTLAPTAEPTAVPAAEAAPAVPDDVRVYLTAMSTRTSNAGAAVKSLSQQSDLAGQNPVLIFDRKWRTDTAVALALVQVDGESLQSYEPVPPDLKQLDALMVLAGKDMVAISHDYANGVDNTDATLINRAATRMQTLTQHMRDALVELQRVEAEYGLS